MAIERQAAHAQSVDDIFASAVLSLRARLRARANAAVKEAAERGVVGVAVYEERAKSMIEEELRREVDLVLRRPTQAEPLPFDRETNQLFVADWPIVLDVPALTNEGRVVLYVGLRCELCGRRTFHHFASKAHFQELIELTGPVVPDERRVSKGRDVRRREAAKCTYCSNGAPTWLVL